MSFVLIVLLGASLQTALGQYDAETERLRTDVVFLQHALRLQDDSRVQVVQVDKDMHSLFVKFHKVAGTTWQLYLIRMIGEWYDCGSLCGNPDWVCEQKAGPNSPEAESCKGQSVSWAVVPFCQDPRNRPRSCTSHPSTDVIREAVSGRTLAVASPVLSDLQNLYPDARRFELLARVSWARSWLPSTFVQKRLKLTTILREPTERLRSYYYYDNAYSSRQGFNGFLAFCRDYVAGNWSLEQFEHQKSFFRGAKSLAILRRSCCEYERYLGEESLEKSLATLSTMFDLVGLQERMDESLVSLGKLYGLTPHDVAKIGRTVPPDCNSNSDKLEWTEEELRMAQYVSNKSQEIYKLGQKLFKNQVVKLFGSEQNLNSAVDIFVKENVAVAQDFAEATVSACIRR
mmetsp:Transcript_3549/g.8564  ORF Transcript_3549/g.8564 Transcript_3549/m.8564 type:complete len:401 (+) Transcript_3549:38-1240(+)|eukprot:s2944_g13.t1